ncbi:MAG: hypothetical protein JW755_07290 [Candidatus Aminicenantes bacterium]|nr:hypothetical protein [Candidatus Aminicenantes bacterium]
MTMKIVKNAVIFVLYITLSPFFAASEIGYPWKEVFIGPLVNNDIIGLTIIPNSESAYAFKLRIKKEEESAQGIDLLYLISEVGPYAADGGYARIKLDLSLPFGKTNDTPILIKPSSKSDTLIFEWSRQDERTVIGRIKSPKYIDIDVVHYFPWDLTGDYQLLPDGQIKGRVTPEKNFYLIWTDRKAEFTGKSLQGELISSFSMEKNQEIYFVAGVDIDERVLANHIYRYKNVKTIDAFLKDEEQRYQKMRVKIDGLFSGAAEAVTNNVLWMNLYQPEYHRLYIPAGRKLIYPQPEGKLDHWTIIEWPAFLSALELSLESSKQAEFALRAVLETQYKNGNIPNWRGRFGGSTDRSNPPLGSYAVLKYFQKTGDLEFLKYSYAFLQKWHSFWKAPKRNGSNRRDGNRDGLLEWGVDQDLAIRSIPEWEKNASGKIKAMWESGQDDLPNWDNVSFNESTGTLNVNCVDLNSLYTLDCWCLAEIANILNMRSDHQRYLEEYEQMKALVNEHFWDEKAGFYFDRYWDGRLSTKKAASNFYPLIAKIPNEERALRMIKHLLDNDLFWGEFIIPTISRDDPAFKTQQYWRGTVSPPVNYLVYQGLKSYGFDAVAAEFAKKSWDLFQKSWENFQLCPENYDSRTGEGGGLRYHSWGALLALIAVEEYLDFTPWEGFRFGMLDPEKKGKASRMSIQGRHYELNVSKSEIVLKEEDREIVKTNGPAIFRRFLYSEQEVYFEVKSLKELEIKLKFLLKGRYRLSVDDSVKEVFKGNSVEFKVPEDSHKVLVLLLEKL